MGRWERTRTSTPDRRNWDQMIDLLFSAGAATTLPRNARAVDTENGSELFPGCLNEIGNKIAKPNWARGQFDGTCYFCYFSGDKGLAFGPEVRCSRGHLTTSLNGNCGCSRSGRKKPISFARVQEIWLLRITHADFYKTSKNTLSVPKFKSQSGFCLKCWNTGYIDQFRQGPAMNKMENALASISN